MNATTAIPAARRVPPLRRALEEARAAGVPQWAVAAEAEISPGALSMIARGTLRPTDETAGRIARALGRRVRELFPER